MVREGLKVGVFRHAVRYVALHWSDVVWRTPTLSMYTIEGTSPC